MTSASSGDSRALLWFTSAVIVTGAAILAHAIWRLPSAPSPLGWLALSALALVAAAFAIKVPGVSAYISISDTFFLASVLLFGPAPATLSIALDSLILSWRRQHSLQKLLFNPTSSALALWAGAQVYYAAVDSVPLAEQPSVPAGTMFLPLAGMAGVYFLLNSGLTVVAVGLDKRVSPLRLWRDHFAVISLNYFAAGSASFFLIVLIRYAGLTAFVAVLPLIAVCYLAMRSWLGRVEDAQRHITKINQMYLSTIGAFSTAIEAKDGVTSGHVHRVQAYALGLARALGVTDPPTVQALEAAALLHDTGKLAVPEHILNKPGKLTPAEFERMKAHVDVGADILSTIDFPYPVVPIVRAHHENWDGTGYPRGLRGEEIPIGARILAVVDCFDALTSDRPYRPAMSEEDALAIIVQRRGTMYDPHVVDTFLRIHRDITPQTSASPHSSLHGVLQHIREQGSTTATVGRPPAEVPDSTDPADPLLAFVSLARVISHRPTLQDLGTLAARQLHELAPGATVVLFTVDAGRGVLAPAYAAGPDAARVGELALDIGRQVSGWVAATWQPMINADARIDLSAWAGPLRFAISLPLVADGRLAGVLTLYAPGPFSERQAQRLEMIAPHLAICVDAVGAAMEARQADRPRTTAPRDFRVITRR